MKKDHLLDMLSVFLALAIVVLVGIVFFAVAYFVFGAAFSGNISPNSWSEEVRYCSAFLAFWAGLGCALCFYKEVTA